MLICESNDDGYKIVEEIEIPKGRRLDVALRKWIEENGGDKKDYALVKLMVPSMKIKISKVKEVVYA